MADISLWAVLVAALSSFVLGGLWYSPALFGKRWMRDAGVGQTSGHPARVYGIAFGFSLVAAYVFARILGPQPELGDALHHGLLYGAAFVATSFGINYQFANRGTALWLIDGGYHVAQFLLYGLVLGLWR